MSQHRLIVFATEAEAAATLTLFQAKRDPNDPGLYQSDIGWIVIPGMGILAVAQAICRYAHLAKEVWNLGVAGALHDHFQLEQLVEIATVNRNPLVPDYVCERSQLFQTNVFPSLSLSPQGKHLVSGDYPIQDLPARLALAARFDMIDMEGYGVANAARYCNLPCHIWKVVSDWAKPGSMELIREKLAGASEIIAKHLEIRCR